MLPLQEACKELSMPECLSPTGFYPYNPAAVLKVLPELKANEDRVAGMQPEDESDTEPVLRTRCSLLS